MAAFMLPGGSEWWIILVVILLLFGPTQLPKLAKMLGKSAKTLKEGLDGKLEDDAADAAPKPPAETEAKKDESGTDA